MVRHVLAIFGLLVISGLIGFAISVFFHSSEERRNEQVGKALRDADLGVDTACRMRLERQAARRARLGAIGGGIGYAFALPAGIMLSDRVGGDLVMIAVGAMFFGMQVGMAVSALRPVDPPSQTVRLSALQPHGLRDYLRRRDLMAESTFAVVGAAASIAGLAVVARDGTGADRGWLAVVLGALMASAAGTVLLLQRRLLAAPIPAGDSSELVVNDVILALGLRDLVGAAFFATFFAGYTAVLVVLPFWYIIPYLGVMVLVSKAFEHKLEPGMTAVAHRLAPATPQP